MSFLFLTKFTNPRFKEQMSLFQKFTVCLQHIKAMVLLLLFFS